MASFVNADLGSDSDPDDTDFDPGKEIGHEGVSEEENSGDDEDPDNKSKKKKKTVAKNAGARSAGCFQDATKDTEGESMKKEFEKEKEELRELADKKKTDDIWSDFLKDVGPKKVAKKTSGGGLGSLSSLGKSKTAAASNSAKTKTKPKVTKASSISSIFDTIGDSSKIEKEKPKTQQQPPSLMSSIFDTIKKAPPPTQPVDAAENQESEPSDESKVKITKVFDFAGEAVEVTKEVDRDSKEAKQFAKQQENGEPKAAAAQKRPGGLNSIMGVISGKKPKMGTLDKSKMDWEEFVNKEGIKEELQTHNKGKDGYVEKQMFLERSDYRRFEIEREAREKSRKSLNK